MTEHTFQMLRVQRPEGDHTYLLHGLPFDAGFKDPENYVTIGASSLKVDGYGFSTSGCEFGEHDSRILVAQASPGGLANIVLPD